MILHVETSLTLHEGQSAPFWEPYYFPNGILSKSSKEARLITWGGSVVCPEDVQGLVARGLITYDFEIGIDDESLCREIEKAEKICVWGYGRQADVISNLYPHKIVSKEGFQPTQLAVISPYSIWDVKEKWVRYTPSSLDLDVPNGLPIVLLLSPEDDLKIILPVIKKLSEKGHKIYTEWHYPSEDLTMLGKWIGALNSIQRSTI